MDNLEALRRDLRIIVIGCSAGGIEALTHILGALPRDYAYPMVVVLHITPSSGGLLAATLSNHSAIPVKEAEDKEPIQPGNIYLAPADYHLLVEQDGSFSLSFDEKVNFSRPSIDVLFESTAFSYKKGVLGVVLTGSSADGSLGLRKITASGGYGIVQDPKTAEFPEMPQAALLAAHPQWVLSVEMISGFLGKL